MVGVGVIFHVGFVSELPREISNARPWDCWGRVTLSVEAPWLLEVSICHRRGAASVHPMKAPSRIKRERLQYILKEQTQFSVPHRQGQRHKYLPGLRTTNMGMALVGEVDELLDSLSTIETLPMTP